MWFPKGGNGVIVTVWTVEMTLRPCNLNVRQLR